MQQSQRRVLAGMLALFFFLAVLAGCGQGGSPQPTGTGEGSSGETYENGLPKDVEVTIKWGFWENGYGREWADHAIEKFTEMYPNVKFEVTASPVIRDLISTKLAARNDDDMFDIVSPSFNGDEGIIAQKEGLFEDMTELWDWEVPDAPGKRLRDVVLDNTMEYADQIDGKFYQIPMGAYAVGLFFNKKLFEEKGWNQNPQTWSEFLELMEAIKQDGMIPITYPGVYPTYVYYGFNIKPFELAQVNGNLEEFTEAYRNAEWPIYTRPEYSEIWKRMYEMGQKGYFVEGAAALNHTQSQMQLLQGKAAIASTGDWVENEMKDSIPEGFEWGFMTIPFVENESDTIWVENGIGAGGIMIWKNKPELVKAWAKEFNMFLMTNEIQAYNGQFGISPIRKDFAEDPENIEKLQSAPRAVLEYVRDNNAQFGTTQKQVSFTHPSAARANKLVTDMIVEVTAGAKDPFPVLEEADQLMKEAIEAESR